MISMPFAMIYADAATYYATISYGALSIAIRQIYADYYADYLREDTIFH